MGNWYIDPRPKRRTAFDGAYDKGQRAFADGKPRSDNPYGDQRTDRGSVTFARAFYRAWDDGWREAERNVRDGAAPSARRGNERSRDE
jgi:hypothetical protein